MYTNCKCVPVDGTLTCTCNDMPEATPEELDAIPAGVSGLICVNCRRKHYGTDCLGWPVSMTTGKRINIPSTSLAVENEDDDTVIIDRLHKLMTNASFGKLIEHLPVDPQTVEDYAKYVKFRAANVERWARTWAENPTVLCEQIARLEGDLAALRILVKHAPRKNDRIDATLGRL